MKEFVSKGEVRLIFKVEDHINRAMGEKERCDMCQDVDVSYVMKVLWKILCISCCTVVSLLVIKEDY